MKTTAMDAAPVVSLAQLWKAPLPEAERLLFMRLPLEKQRLALDRVAAMNRFEDGTSAAQIYPGLGLAKARFYKLVKAWKGDKSLASLVPYATEESRERGTKLHPAVVKLIQTCMEESAAAQETITEYELIKRIRARAQALSLAVPAAVTLSRHLAKEAMADQALSLAPVARGTGVNPGDIFGAHLIIDHTTADLIVNVDGQVLKPTLTLILDDASRVILGACLSPTYPSPEAVTIAVIDARRRYEALRSLGVRAVPGLRPYFSARFAPSWSEVDVRLRESGMSPWNVTRAADNRRGYGRLIRRFMLTRIGDVGLLTTPTWMEPMARVPKADESKYGALGWDDAKTIVDEAIERHNRSRLPFALELSKISAGDLKSRRIEDSSKDYLKEILESFSAASDSADGHGL